MKTATLKVSQPKLESPVFSKMAAASATDHILSHQAKQFFIRDERHEFYGGKDRKSLQSSSLIRVRELHEANDNLQRQIERCQQELLQSQDPLSIHAEIEHCEIILARNTGEILNIYSVNEARLRRISELQARNLELEEQMRNSQNQFISTRDMNERTQFATDFFLHKSTHDRNLSEIKLLSLD
ncbi:MAG: hypothetical protein EBZ47_03145 [Chlamydiae bacterium]|nr:hypothetical protein [Chlamydiota bacterium]